MLITSVFVYSGTRAVKRAAGKVNPADTCNHFVVPSETIPQRDPDKNAVSLANNNKNNAVIKNTYSIIRATQHCGVQCIPSG